jgi:hypothetical protein
MQWDALPGKREESDGGNRRISVAIKPARISSIQSALSRVIMKHRWLWIVVALFPTLRSSRTVAQSASQTNVQTERGPYSRIAILRPNEGDSVDFEAGYIRHLAWHQQAKDSWVWYGWTIWAGERQRWFVYATFGHSAASLDNPVAPADDERDSIVNVNPHVQFLGSAIYEYLPALSRGSGNTGEPQPTTRLESTTVDLVPGADRAFEAAVSAGQSALQAETLWYRMVAGGVTPRYVRLRARPSVSAILDGKSEQALPDSINRLVAKTTIEILNLRPTMCYGLSAAH